jgi:membrane associated rhomboid family serine protease
LSPRATPVILAVPLYDDNPTARAPIATHVLIGLCVGAFLWQLGHSPHAVAVRYGMIPAVLFGTAHLPAQLYAVPAWMTLFTSMFLHGGWLHLIGNMLFLWIFGNNVEDQIGHGRYLFLYLASGVAAALVQAFSSPASHVPMIGASGAIAGVLGAYLLLFPRANVHVFLWIVIFFRIVTVPAWLLLGLWFLLQLLGQLGHRAGTPGVAFGAHAGGFIAGLILILLLRPVGVALLQPSRSRVFAAAHPSLFAGRGTFHHGSVPSAGRRLGGPRGPFS